MLHHLDDSLEAFLREAVPLPRGDVDVAFEAPDDEWRAGVNKPTLNLFLWDIRLSGDEIQSGRNLVERDGKRVWSDAVPRVAFRYLITAWTSEVRDEHQLLGSVLMALLPTRFLHPRFLAGDLAGLEPAPNLSVARVDGKDFAEFWSALEGQLKPGLDLTVTASVDAALTREAGPPVGEFGVAVADRSEPARRSDRRTVGGHVEDPEAVGATVRSPRGKGTVNERGDFSVPARPGDAIVVETVEPRRFRTPERGEAEPE